MLSHALGVSDLDQRKERDHSRNSRQDCCRSSGTTLNRAGQEYPTHTLGERWQASGRLGVASSHTQRTFREIHSQEAAEESVETEPCSSFRSLQLTSHIPNKTGGIGV